MRRVWVLMLDLNAYIPLNARVHLPAAAGCMPFRLAMSDPALLFSPSQLSSLTDSSVEPSPPPQLTMSTRRIAQFYVAPPKLSPSVKELYQQPPDYLGGDPEFVRNDLDAVVGEYPLDSQRKPSHYFVRFKDGFARRVSHSSLLPSPFLTLNFL